MSVIPCQQNAELKTKIVEFAEVLKTLLADLGPLQSGVHHLADDPALPADVGDHRVLLVELAQHHLVPQWCHSAS